MQDTQALDQFRDYLDANNLKMTEQRKLILEVFLDCEGHMASEELYDAVKRVDPSLGQATVYRTLKLLADAGLAKAVDFGDGITRYESRLGEEHHDHLICTNCRKTEEIFDERIERLQEQVALAHGFELTGHKMYLYGLCAQCRAQKREEQR